VIALVIKQTDSENTRCFPIVAAYYAGILGLDFIVWSVGRGEPR
jgi:hypothetical protein